jgi:hypothetical protein
MDGAGEIPYGGYGGGRVVGGEEARPEGFDGEDDFEFAPAVDVGGRPVFVWVHWTHMLGEEEAVRLP